MTSIFAGRFAAHTEEPFVLFLIGMRVNNLWAVRRWVPTLTAMLDMLKELDAKPELGVMGSSVYFFPPTAMVVQYWRSFEHLESFARNPDGLHIPAWKRFYHEVGKSDVVGVYHETYLVEPGKYEAVYLNMPRFGLGQAVAHVPATGRLLTARRRLGSENLPALEVHG
ncbi:MAG: DUF4188 domain-containing protein [Chloroflexota bacterium]|nr:DUF4188 domain-containing protein [Chloroflexota bacterium]